MKAYTDLSQSKKLAEILPHESADMFYFRQIDIDYFPPNVESICPIPLFKDGKEDFDYDIPCWSLAALLDVYPMCIGRNSGTFRCWVDSKCICSDSFDNLVDACMDMILKLKERNLL